jgi:hypothetical protein
MFVRLMVLLGYAISTAMATDTKGWDDPVFSIVRRIPYTPYSWAVLLAVSATVLGIGELGMRNSRFRGATCMIGAGLCSAWFLALALCMARMVYVMPDRITDLWPLVMFFLSCLYATRIIAYANAFTGARWISNPYQLTAITGVTIVSMSQVVIGVAPGTIFTEIERPAQLQVAICNLIGSSIVLFGLHLRNAALGLQLELAGSVTLVLTLGWYCYSVTHQQELAGTTLGFGMVEAALVGSVLRGMQILALQYAGYANKPELAAKLKQSLAPDPLILDELKPEHGGQ